MTRVFAQLTCGQSCDAICNVGQSGTQTACCGAPYQGVCFNYPQSINNAYCSSDSVSDSCSESDVINACPGGLPPVIFNGNLRSYTGGFCSSEIQVCSPYIYCNCHEWRTGDCSGGPDTNGQAELRNLVCPASCTPGQNFNITYEYRSTNYDGPVDLWRKVIAYGHPPYLGSLQWHTTSDPGSSCKVDDNLTSPSTWQVATQAINCSEIWEGFSTNPNIIVYGYNRDWDVSGFSTWCDDSSPSADVQLSCQVKRTIPSLGYLKVWHQALGTIKLNLISANDAKAKSPFPGMVKVAIYNGDIGSAADLVATSDPMASPVRVYTGLTDPTQSPNGIWSWKKLP